MKRLSTHYLRHKLIVPIQNLFGIKRRILMSRSGTLDKIVQIHKPSKTVFIPIPKAANSSVINILWAAHGSLYQGQRQIHDALREADSLIPQISKYSDQELEELLTSRESFRFTFVRNPYTRIVSSYKDKIINPKRNYGFLKRIRWSASQPPSFDQFVDIICNQSDDEMDWHWRPQSSLILSEICELDFIGKVESFNDDIEVIFDRLNLNEEELKAKLRQPVNEQSTNEHYLTEHSAKKIAERYKQDFKQFGYSLTPPGSVH